MPHLDSAAVSYGAAHGDILSAAPQVRQHKACSRKTESLCGRRQTDDDAGVAVWRAEQKKLTKSSILSPSLMPDRAAQDSLP